MLISTTINDALIQIGVINPIDEASPQEYSFGLRTLNRIVDAYNGQSLIVTYLQDIFFPQPTAGWKNSVTIGNGLEIDQASPSDVQGAFFRQDDTDHQLKPMSFNEWSQIAWKNSEGIPSRYYLQYTDNNNIKIYFDKIPQNNLTLHLMAKMPYTGVNGEGNDYIPTDNINWNYGFEKMLMLRLAIELCPSYGLKASDELKSLANEAENDVKARNYQSVGLRIDMGLSNGTRDSRNNRARY